MNLAKILSLLFRFNLNKTFDLAWKNQGKASLNNTMLYKQKIPTETRRD